MSMYDEPVCLYKCFLTTRKHRNYTLKRHIEKEHLPTVQHSSLFALLDRDPSPDREATHDDNSIYESYNIQFDESLSLENKMDDKLEVFPHVKASNILYRK